MRNIDNHHFAYDRASHIREEFARKIRQHPGMILHGAARVDHIAYHREFGPIEPPTRSLAVLRLTHLMGMGFQDARLAAVPHSEFLWNIAEADGPLSDEAAKHAQHLEHQINFFGLRDFEPGI